MASPAYRDPVAPPSHLDLSDEAGDSVVYAIGDVHGTSDLLGRLIGVIEADAASQSKKAVVIFLGDMVNRGADTSGVVKLLIAGPRRAGDRWFAVRGNHEQALLDAFKGKPEFDHFVRKGGLETLLSYGLRRKDFSVKAMREAIPASHIGYLDALPLTCRIGSLLFVHAGLEAGKPLERQSREILLNIREPFLSVAPGQPYTVVHGHVPSSGEPVQKPWRICVDTGAVITGVLTAAAFDPSGEIRFLQVKRS